ncbi:DUF547 domain-containing protein [Winogradskyella sp.]|nr:DUF547 domain-containing protein [Winogradskyella sp.]
MKIASLYIALLVTLASGAQDLETFFSKTDTFLKAHVTNGKVAYARLHKAQSQLNELLTLAETITIDVTDAKNYQAFWINAYNIAVIKGIIDSYPLKSPLDHKGFFDKTTYYLGGKKTTLNFIENTLLRGNFNDARFHFALVCGAIGCPPLIAEVYLPNTLNTQLETQTKLALNGNFLKVNANKQKVEVSEIMKWYNEDFTRNGMTEINFINRYRIEKIPDNYKLGYFTYNWNLNEN